MALNIKHPEADRLARDLAPRTGESVTDAVGRGSGVRDLQADSF